GITDRETNMEDTHVWVMNADGSNRGEIGEAIDNRQGPPQGALDGAALYFTVQHHGNNVLVRRAIGAETPGAGAVIATIGVPNAENINYQAGFVTSFSLRRDKAIAYTYWSPTDLPQLFLLTSNGGTSRQLTK